MDYSHARAERDIRQRQLVPSAQLAEVTAAVIGVGAVGRQVALQLASLGIPRMLLYDDDVVAVENLAPQGYWPEDLGAPKVAATAMACRRAAPEIEVTHAIERFARNTGERLAGLGTLAMFCCVDTISARRSVWEAVRPMASFFGDGRMSAEVIRVLASGEPRRDRCYRTTLFPQREAYVGACTARSTIYAASVAAGIMLAQFARWLRGQPVVADQTLNLLAAELTVPETTRKEVPCS